MLQIREKVALQSGGNGLKLNWRVSIFRTLGSNWLSDRVSGLCYLEAQKRTTNFACFKF